MQLTFLSEEPPVSRSALRGFERDFLTLAETSCSPTGQWLAGIVPAGWFGRMSPASCRLTKDGILAPSSGCWQNSGMGSPTAFLTLSTSEHTASEGLFLSGAVVCSLSDILETGDEPLERSLTARACLGILRRAEKRGKVLPPLLARALQAVAGSGPTSTATEG